mmetsp:Transcript_24538/g.54956  ORF Transcript_24538/g.54956 Transcript_24538/m.54956 type:complete len:320 (+) Transcript_24538:195-1154(+)
MSQTLQTVCSSLHQSHQKVMRFLQSLVCYLQSQGFSSFHRGSHFRQMIESSDHPQMQSLPFHRQDHPFGRHQMSLCRPFLLRDHLSKRLQNHRHHPGRHLQGRHLQDRLWVPQTRNLRQNRRRLLVRLWTRRQKCPLHRGRRHQDRRHPQGLRQGLPTSPQMMTTQVRHRQDLRTLHRSRRHHQGRPRQMTACRQTACRRRQVLLLRVHHQGRQTWLPVLLLPGLRCRTTACRRTGPSSCPRRRSPRRRRGRRVPSSSRRTSARSHRRLRGLRSRTTASRRTASSSCPRLPTASTGGRCRRSRGDDCYDCGRGACPCRA